LWIARFATLKQFKVFLERAVAVQAIMHILADLQIELKDVKFVEETDWAGQQDAFLERVKDFLTILFVLCFLSGKETFLADRSEEADHNFTDLVFLKSDGLVLAMTPF